MSLWAFILAQRHGENLNLLIKCMACITNFKDRGRCNFIVKNMMIKQNVTETQLKKVPITRLLQYYEKIKTGAG